MRYLPLALLIASLAPPLMAQAPASDARIDEYAMPAGITVHVGKAGRVYADARGMTLYLLNRRLAGARTGTVETYCMGPCQQSWAPLKANADAQPTGLWKVVKGVEGPQWSFRDSPVFTYKADAAPGATDGDGFDDVFSAMAYVPPAPDLVAPANVTARFVAGAYVLVDADGRLLFTGTPGTDWVPLAAGLATLRKVGDWTVEGSAERPQWAFRGKAVFVGRTSDPSQLPATATVLQP